MARDRNEDRQILGVFTTDTHLVVRTWDAFLTRITGIAAADALGQPIGALLPGLDDRGLLTRFRDVAASGTVEVLSPALHHGLIVSTPEGSATTAPHMRQRITIGPVREDGRITGVAVTVEDVTAGAERERAASELARRLGDHGLACAVRRRSRTLEHRPRHRRRPRRDAAGTTPQFQRPQQRARSAARSPTSISSSRSSRSWAKTMSICGSRRR